MGIIPILLKPKYIAILTVEPKEICLVSPHEVLKVSCLHLCVTQRGGQSIFNPMSQDYLRFNYLINICPQQTITLLVFLFIGTLSWNSLRFSTTFLMAMLYKPNRCQCRLWLCQMLSKHYAIVFLACPSQFSEGFFTQVIKTWRQTMFWFRMFK